MPRVQDALPSLDCRAWKGRSNPLLLSALRFAPESRPAVMDGGIAAIADLKGRSIERAPGKAHLLAFSFIDLVTVRDVLEAIRIELFRILPMARIQARARMGA